MSARAPFLSGASVALAAYALGAAPTLTPRDAGELTAAAFLLDVPHPTGFPFDLALVRLAMLLPVGSVALRADLAVGALMALACGLAAALAWTLTPSLPRAPRALACAVPVAAVLASPTVLRAATATEVYAGATLLALASLWNLSREDLPLAPRRRVTALLAGLSLASHTSARPAAALALAWLTLSELPPPRVSSLARRLLPVGGLGALGATLLAALPLASLRGGPIDWDHPATPAALWRYLSARSIRSGYASRMLVPWRLPEDLAHSARILAEDLGVALCLLGLAGALVAGRTRSRVALAVLAVAAVDLAYTVALNPMGTIDRQTMFLTEFGLAVLAAGALGALASLRSPWGARAAGLAGAALVATTVARADPGFAGAADGWAASELFGDAGALGALPPRAVALCISDDLCGGAMYLQWVEGVRPDVTVLPRQHLDQPWTWRRYDPARVGLTPSPPRGRDLRVARLRALVALPGDQVRWEGSGTDDERLAGVSHASGETPILARVRGEVTDVDRSAPAWVSSRLPPRPGRGARWVGAAALSAAGQRVARAGEMERAATLWREAVGLFPCYATAYTNLGVAAVRRGDLAGAEALTERALACDPERPTAWRNLARYRALRGDSEGAGEAEREASRRGL